MRPLPVHRARPEDRRVHPHPGRITVLGADEGRLGRLAAALGSGASRPSVCRAPLSWQLVDPRSVGVLIIDDGPSTDSAALGAALAFLDRTRAPCLVLTADPARWEGRASAHNAVILPPDAPPLALLAAASALVARQPVLDDMAEELMVLRATHRGLRSELDRLHEELQLASRVQAEFMPKTLPEVRGLDLGVLFRPCGYVSGDIYDVQELDDGRIGVFLADAMGHGVPAALLTTALCRALVTREPGPGGGRLLEPAEAMTRLNRSLAHHAAGVSRFATAVYAVLDPVAGIVTVAGAGHPPPLRFGDDGRRAFETEGPVLGVFPEAEFSQVSFELEPGQALILHTDGLEQAFPEPDRDVRRPSDGYLRVLESIAGDARAQELAMTEAMLRLSCLIDGQAGSLSQADDVTAVAIMRPRREAQRSASAA